MVRTGGWRAWAAAHEAGVCEGDPPPPWGGSGLLPSATASSLSPLPRSFAHTSAFCSAPPIILVHQRSSPLAMNSIMSLEFGIKGPPF